MLALLMWRHSDSDAARNAVVQSSATPAMSQLEYGASPTTAEVSTVPAVPAQTLPDAIDSIQRAAKRERARMANTTPDTRESSPDTLSDAIGSLQAASRNKQNATAAEQPEDPLSDAIKAVQYQATYPYLDASPVNPFLKSRQ